MALCGESEPRLPRGSWPCAIITPPSPERMLRVVVVVLIAHLRTPGRWHATRA